jgi:addiction module RelE/StbE family toxin
MVREIVWSQEAVKDLEAVFNYIAKDSQSYAASFIGEIRLAGRSLNQFAERGRVVPEAGQPNIREIFVRDYRLIYHIEQTRVEILALIHGARDLKKLWKAGSKKGR